MHRIEGICLSSSFRLVAVDQGVHSQAQQVSGALGEDVRPL